MSNFLVGLTGGIGCGKSTVTALFAKLGVQYVDADIVAREVVMPGTACLDAICRHFGSSILNSNGELDRAALRQRVFTNATDRLRKAGYHLTHSVLNVADYGIPQNRRRLVLFGGLFPSFFV